MSKFIAETLNVFLFGILEVCFIGVAMVLTNIDFYGSPIDQWWKFIILIFSCGVPLKIYAYK